MIKGFVFTLDALFALLLAGIGISLLLFFAYTAPTPYYVQASSSSSPLSGFASAKLGSLSSIPLVNFIAQQDAASNQTWPMPIKDQYNDGGNNNGPQAFTLNYVFNATAAIVNGTIVSDYGNVYFGAGNVIYALNVSTGNTSWTSNTLYNSVLNTDPVVNADLLYGGFLIYATQADIVALSAYNGSVVWSSPTPYIAGNKVKLYLYDGKLITYVYDSSSPSSSPLYAIYANNGTTVGSSTQHQNVIQYLAISNGQIVASSSSGSISMFTQILNSSYSAGQIWTMTPSCSPYPIGLAAYLDIIAYGCGDNANLNSVSNSPIFSAVQGSAVSGVSIYSDSIAFQDSSGVSLYSAAGSYSYQWSESIPSSYGTAVLNATPAISSSSVYTLWSNKYLLMQNLSTGAITANTSIPYSGSINPYMALAYGRLFASVGSHLMAFGSCPVNTNDSILSAIGTLYINGRGSCASYILSKLQQPSNYAITINGLVQQNAAQFNGASSQINVISTSLLRPNYITLSLWVQLISTGNYQYIVDTSSDSQTSTSGMTFQVTPGLNGYYITFGNVINNGFTSFNIGSGWNQFVFTYAGANVYTYVNGQQESTFTASGNIIGWNSDPIVLGESEGGNAVWMKGNLANVQIYNTSLSPSQITTLYQEGIGGSPLPASGLVGWWPLNGNTNSYANQYTAGYPTDIQFQTASYNSVSLQSSYSVTSQSVPIPLLNYSKGAYKLYNVGIYSWK